MSKAVPVTPSTNGNGEETPQTETWFSVSEAADYAGRTKTTLRKALANEKFSSIFGNENAVKAVLSSGFEPIVKIAKSAIDTWLEATQKNMGGVATRKARSDLGRRYVVRIKDEHVQQARDALYAIDPAILLDTGYKPRAKKAATAKAPSTSGTFTHELIEESDLVSA